MKFLIYNRGSHLRDGGRKLNEEEERLGVVFLRDAGQISKVDYAKHFEFNDKKAQRHLSKFLDLEIVTSKGQSRNTSYTFKKSRRK